MIERSDIKPHPIKAGETEIVLQRHGKYIRAGASLDARSVKDLLLERHGTYQCGQDDGPDLGSLTGQAAIAETAAAAVYFEFFLAGLQTEEGATVDVLFVASDTRYLDGGQRSYETAGLAQMAAEAVFEANGLPASNILNAAWPQGAPGGAGPTPVPKLREPNFLNESPGFLDYMLDKYGGPKRELTTPLWVAFEEDTEREVRLQMGAEGPDDIADRTIEAVHDLECYAANYHHTNPGRRLIVWAGTHYDTISPFVKRELFGVGRERLLRVDYGAGITIDIDTEGHAVTEIAGREYVVPD